MNAVSQLMHDLDIKSLDKLTSDDMLEIMKRHQQGKITIAQLEQIAKMVPHFAKIAAETAKAITESAKSAGKSQQSALEEIGKTRDAILSLASHPKITEETLKLIIEQLSEIAKQIERMSHSNNSLFSTMTKGMALFGIALLGVLGAGLALESKDKT